MDWSRDEALKLLLKWKSDNTELFVVCQSEGESSLLLQATGRIRDLSSDTLEIAWADGSFLVCFADIQFPERKEVEFNYAEPKEDPPPFERLRPIDYECCLEILAFNSKCLLYQITFPSLVDDGTQRNAL